MGMRPRGLLRRVLTYARAEIERRARTHPSEQVRPELSVEPEAPSIPQHADEAHTNREHDGSPTVHGLEVVREGAQGLLTLRWSVDEDDVARAQALIGGAPVLCLRVVSFSKARDDVLREVQDRPGLELSGECEIVEPQRAVVSLGLRAGERFVSIAHHVL